MSNATKTVPVVAFLLATAVLVETLLFRIFARGGVYFIDEHTPAAVKNGYTSLVFTGNTLFNFAAPVAIIVIGLLAARAWSGRPEPVSIAVAGSAGAVALIGLLLMIGLSGTLVSTSYYAASSLVLVGAFALAIRRRAGLPVTAFVLLIGMSYLAVYSFKGFGSVALAEAGLRSVSVFALGEWLSVVAFVALLPLLRDRLDKRAIVIATLVAVMAIGMTFSRADSVPLIANWAFGLTLSLPYFAYAATLWIVAAFVVTSFRYGDTTLAAGILLIMLGHRAIPLTYFNDLALIGMLLAAMYAKPVRRSATRQVAEPASVAASVDSKL